MSESQRSLVRKLAEVMATVERIPKRGRNEFHRYDYATEADIAATVRTELSTRHVMLIPSITGESRHPVGEKGSVLTVIEMEMEFLDGESGESIKKPWRGYGTDKEDKGGYKAMTGGEKYFLLKTFLMPTGDDPEEDGQTAKPTPSVARSQPAAPPRVHPTQRPQARPTAPPRAQGKSVRVISAKVAKEGSSEKGPWTLYAIKFSDGREGTTFSKSVYQAAAKALDNVTEVEPTIEGKNLTKLEPVFRSGVA